MHIRTTVNSINQSIIYLLSKHIKQ